MQFCTILLFLLSPSIVTFGMASAISDDETTHGIGHTNNINGGGGGGGSDNCGGVKTGGEDEGDEMEVEEGGNAADELDAAFTSAARGIQNRITKKVGSETVESRRFTDFFGCRLEIAMLLWRMLEEYEIMPNKGKIKHLLWTLYFLKVYPKQSPGCSAVGATTGAVDPKTLRKWVWEYIELINDLTEVVVRHILFLL